MNIELNRLISAILRIDEYFQSGNNIPVERATILYKDWEPIKESIDFLKEHLFKED